MYSIKEEAMHAISSLPEGATSEDIMYRLYVIDKIHKAELEELRGEKISLNELKEEAKNW